MVEIDRSRSRSTASSQESGVVAVRPRVPADDPRIVEIGNLLGPDYPELTVEEFRQLMASVPPQFAREHFVAEAGGEIVGTAWFLQKFWVEQRGSFVAGVQVHPDRRRRGIGSCLYDRLQQSAEEAGAERLFAEVRADRPEALRFAERRAFVRTGCVGRMSRLDVESVNLEGYAGLEERLAGEGIRVASMAELGADDETLQLALYGVDMSTSQDEPSSEPYSMPFEQWRDALWTRPGHAPDRTFLALHETTPIGYARLRRQGRDGAWNEGLGVERPYRGRGVARLIKLKTIEYARAHGIRSIWTQNDVENPRVYAINVRLGYRPLPEKIELVRELAAAK